jgi:hypothetical protein
MALQGGVIFGDVSVPMEKMFLLTLYPFAKVYDFSHLGFGIKQLRRLNILEEEANISNCFLFIEFKCKFPLFFRSGTLSAACLGSPSVMKKKHCVIAACEIFVDQFLWAAYAAECVFPTHRRENDAIRFAVILIELGKNFPEKFSFRL